MGPTFLQFKHMARFSFGSAMARIIPFGPKWAKHLEAEVEHILSVFWSADLSQGPPCAAL